MPSPYRAIFARPGTRGFSTSGLVGRMPIAMLGIGVITMVSELTGRYALAGALAATLALSTATFGPQIARLVDRHGQRRVLRPAVLVALASLTVLLVCVRLRLPDWMLFAAAMGSGCMPSLGAMVRSRWAAILEDAPRELHTAYSFESIVDELCFILGPIISIGLCTVWFPEAGPLLAGVLLAIGVFTLTAQRATEPAPHPREQHGGGSALRSPGLRVLVAAFVAVGVIFSSVDVVTVAFAEEAGRKSAASLVLAVFALGSCLAALVFGLLHLRGPAARRWLLGVNVLAVSMIPLRLVDGLPLLTCALFLAGMSVAPTLVTSMGLVAEHVPRSKLTEGMGWTSTGIAVGVSIGAAVSGWVVDNAGARAAYSVPVVAGVLAAGVAFLGYRKLLRPPHRTEGFGVQRDSGTPDGPSTTSLGRTGGG
ncbi:MFS transporter [Streptomyces sp. TP-A0874]|uniref:MFS transporter n=1 Tax=Streptomyces sp. TP-A0874 TaxID=549819 RepID=UPI000853432A|nr:MFS transporter [Streptomyces sp. TP-A0874]